MLKYKEQQRLQAFASNKVNENPKLELARLLQEKARRVARRKIYTYYPKEGPLRRELYRKHMAFFKLGATINTRGFIAANRVGKTEGAGGYETALHLTGDYPDWWEGARFDAPVRCWVAGDTGKSVRDITQEKLLGPYGQFGTGLILGDRIGRFTPKSGIPEAVDTLWVKHFTNGVYDGDSKVTFKSYDQGRELFQGTEQDIIWLDEESNESIRNECALRLMTTDGLLIETFTPLRGITPVVMQYLPKGEMNDAIQETGVSIVGDSKALVMAGWDDVPHLGESEKKRMLEETPPHLRDARSKGIPSLGSGAIYPVPETDIKVKDFSIPNHWPRAFAMDVGWNRTAAIWGAWDRENDVLYLYAEHYRSQAEPVIHAQSIKSKGDWIKGVVDPASRGRSQVDGDSLIEIYKNLGLQLTPADNQVEAGIYEVWQRLSTGRLKVFGSCVNWFTEYRMYRRDEKGKIVKENDHVLDATRYLVMSGLKVAQTQGYKKAQGKFIQGPGMLDPEIGY